MRKLKFLVLVVSLSLIIPTALLNHAIFDARADTGKETDMSHPASISFEGPLITLSSIEIGGNSTYTISNGIFVLNDTIVLQENATLIVENAELRFNMSSRTIIQAYDNSTIIIVNSTVFHVLGYAYMYSYDLTYSSIETSFLRRIYVYFEENSTALVEDSTFTYDLYLYDYSEVMFVGSIAYEIGAYENSVLSLYNSALNYVYVYDSADVSLVDSEIAYGASIEFEQDSDISLSLPHGLIDKWNLYVNNTVTKSYVNLTLQETKIFSWRIYARNTAIVSITDSMLEYLYAYTNSSVSISNCVVDYLYVYDYANTSLIDSVVSKRAYLEFEFDSSLSLSLPQGLTDYWNLYANNSVTAAYIDITLQNSSVNSWGIYAYRSTITFSNTQVDTIYGYYNSTISLWESTVNGLYGYEYSVFSVKYSTLNYLSVSDSTSAAVKESILQDISAYQNSSISIVSSRTQYVEVYDYATISILDSYVSRTISMSFVEDSVVFLDSLPTGAVSHWNLYENETIVEAYINLTIHDTLVRGWGNIYTSGTATVSISNSIVEAIYSYGNSQISLENCLVDYIYAYDYVNTTITSSAVNYEICLAFRDDTNIAFRSLSPGFIEDWNLYEDAAVARAYVNHTIVNTWIGKWSIYIYDSSDISIFDSTLNYVYFYGSSTGEIADSTCYGVYAYDTSQMQMTDSTINYIAAYGKSTVSVLRSTIKNELYSYDDSTTSVADSKILSRLTIEFEEGSDVSNVSLPRGLVSHWNLTEDTVATRVYVNLLLHNTTVNAWRVYVRAFSLASFEDSIIDAVNIYSLSYILMENCTVENMYTYGGSVTYISDSSPSKSSISYLYTYEASTVTVVKSSVAIIYAYKDSSIELLGSAYGVIRVQDRAVVMVSWFLEVHVVDSIGQDVPSADVIVYYGYVGGPVADSKFTDSNGISDFTLTEKVVNATGEYPYGNYAVKATYGSYSSSTTVDMTGNKQITLTLYGFMVPELQPLIILFLFMIVTLLAAVVYKRKNYAQ